MTTESIELFGSQFELFLSEEKIQRRIQELATDLNPMLKDDTVLLIVLNGSLFFASDLMKALNRDIEYQCVKIKSYEGMERKHQAHFELGLNSSIQGRSLIIIEDIVDSGATLNFLIQELKLKDCHHPLVVSLLRKPMAVQYQIPEIIVGFDIPNDFVIGYGLDYDGRGRNLKNIYRKI